MTAMTRNIGSGNMPTLNRAIVSIPPGIEAAYRRKLVSDFPDIPDLAKAPFGLLMRFAILIQIGIPEEIAKQGLKGLSRGRHANRENFTIPNE